MRDKTVKTFLSLCLLNLFLFLQLVAATEQISHDLYHGKDPKLQCAVAHHAWHVDIEVATTDIPLPAGTIFVSEQSTEIVSFVARDYIFSPGRGPPAFHA